MRLVRFIVLGVVALYVAMLASGLGEFGLGGTSPAVADYGYGGGHLIVVKHVVNDDGGTATASQFEMTIGGVFAMGGNSFQGSESGTDKLVTGGSYTVTETGPAGYAASFSAGCTGTIAAGQTKTCTVTNDDIAVTVTGSGAISSPLGGNVSFSLSASNTHGTTSGTCTVNEPKTKSKIKCLDATSVTSSATASGTTAVITGNAIVNGVATTYTITVLDAGSPGVGYDTFAIDANSFHRSGTLTDGNITIRLS